MELPNFQLILTCHCRKATELLSESQDRDLTASERWALRLHLAICRSCRRAARQLQQLRMAITEMPDEVRQALGDRAAHLSSERKAQIVEAMRKQS